MSSNSATEETTFPRQLLKAAMQARDTSTLYPRHVRESCMTFVHANAGYQANCALDVVFVRLETLVLAGLGIQLSRFLLAES